MLWINLLLGVFLSVAAKPLEISLNAPWQAPSESLVLLETLAAYNASAFFPLVAVVVTEDQKPDGNSSAALLSAASKFQFVPNSTLGLVEQEWKLGSSIPTIDGHFQLFETALDEKNQRSAASFDDCAVVAWIEGEYSCDITDLYALQAPDEPMTPLLQLSDHVIGSGAQWIVAYADVFSPDFQSWHSVLLEMAQTGKISYVLRHRPSIDKAPSQNRIGLAGYAAGVHVKSTDYLVVDDRQLEGEELKLDLEAPHRVPATKLPFLGFNAARKVRELGEGAHENGLAQFELLKDISFNFPAHAPGLAADASVEDLEAEQLANNLQLFGTNAMFLNGQLLRSKDVFQFYGELRREAEAVSVLQRLLPENTDVPRLLSSGVAFDNSDFDYSDTESITKVRYDLRESGSAIGWINDIEQDVQYQRLDDELEMLQSGGAFVPLRKNMHSIVIAGDLTDARMLSVVKALVTQIGEQLPLQLGIVSNTKEWVRAAKFGIEGRQIFLQHLLRGGRPNDALSTVIKMYQQEGSPLQKPLSDPAEWMQRFGVDPVAGPVVFVNGIPQAFNNWNELAVTIFENDAEYLRSLKSIKPSDSLRDLLFATGLPVRNRLLNPLEKDVVFTPWPLTSPIQAFKNPNDLEKTKHSVLLSSSFATPEAFDVVIALLERSKEKNDVDVFVRPLAGINDRLYAAMVDTSYNMFRFSSDLFSAAKAHFFNRKTSPRVFEVAQDPKIPHNLLPTDADSLIIDGRFVSLNDVIHDETPDLLDKLVDREKRRLDRIAEYVPGISGIAVAGLTHAVQTRSRITSDEKPDFTVQGSSDSLRLTVIVDPASADGQELLALATTAVNAKANVDVHLAPSELSEVPTRFYRPVLDRSAKAEFSNLSEDVLYTAELIEPAAWLTVASESDYDLDNIILNTVKEDSLRATYSLHSLLVQGFSTGAEALDTSLDLRYVNGTKIGDTAVMANLGYFQLSAPRPGAYQVCHSSNSHSFVVENDLTDCLSAPIFSFEGSILSAKISGSAPTVRTIRSKKEGSFWNKLKNIGGTSEYDNSPSTTATINIFTIASGHLYERFASIMMLSVMRHTKHSVKFWLIENFMSPTFKEFVPELAKEHGFEYEFVSYKWPSWLRKQTIKQRQIWGYKMLFLDVLFPQSLSNVIFVDSDQIARTDFKELLDIDLGKAPYAFTPMGDDREEMEPYRFWKQGFWKQMLLDEGYQYHISALYRVDLKRFRKQKVGDILRQQYQRLSADPQNLANLDQDLPNSLQPVVPIYSLPQQWLWCETWCSDAGLSWAKTIDLCNNPLTKEPKLDRARRQIPEWTEYDDMVADFAKKLKAKRSSTQSDEKANTSQPKKQKKEHADSKKNLHDEL